MRFGSLPATVLLSCSTWAPGSLPSARIGVMTTATFTMEQDAEPREEIMAKAIITVATIRLIAR